jgi:hypothetical protein
MLEALLAWLLAEADQQPLLLIVEDLHWVDPPHGRVSQSCSGPRADSLCSLFTFRPDFSPPWTPCAHPIPIALSRLSPSQTEAMVERVTGGKALPAELQRQIVARTDGVPLAIPATLHDALMAWLDRQAPVKAGAQLGAIIGRTFPYDLLHALAHFEEPTLQTGLRQLSLLMRRIAVHHPRSQRRLPRRKHEWWLADLARAVGVLHTTLHRWRQARWYAHSKRWVAWADEAERQRLKLRRALPTGDKSHRLWLDA